MYGGETVLEDEAPSNLELMNMKVPSLLGGGSKQMVTSPRIATVSFVSCRTSRTVSIFFWCPCLPAYILSGQSFPFPYE